MNGDAATPAVYMVRCRDGSLYTGWSTCVESRVAAHNAGRGARYTAGRRPVTLVYCERAADRAAAMRRERALKRFSREQKECLVARWLEEHTKEQRTTPEPFMFVPALSDDGNMEGCS